jgi:hypothetical protein
LHLFLDRLQLLACGQPHFLPLHLVSGFLPVQDSSSAVWQAYYTPFLYLASMSRLLLGIFHGRVSPSWDSLAFDFIDGFESVASWELSEGTTPPPPGLRYV